MNISCNIQTTEEDNFTLSADEAAASVLGALGGDINSDLCSVTITQSPQMGTAGSAPGLAPSEPLPGQEP